MADLIRIIAKIELLAGEKVRQKPFASGYRPLFNFNEASTKISGKIDLINMDIFAPGTTGIVEITFLRGILNDDYFTIDKVFSFDEGQQLLGKGRIIDVISNSSNL